MDDKSEEEFAGKFGRVYVISLYVFFFCVLFLISFVVRAKQNRIVAREIIGTVGRIDIFTSPKGTSYKVVFNLEAENQITVDEEVSKSFIDKAKAGDSVFKDKGSKSILLIRTGERVEFLK